MADWAAGSARRRESCLQMGCYALVLSALPSSYCASLASSYCASLASSYGESLASSYGESASESLAREGVSTALAWWRECSSRAYAVQ